VPSPDFVIKHYDSATFLPWWESNCHIPKAERGQWTPMFSFPYKGSNHLLRMVSWNLNTMRFGGDWIPSSSEIVAGFLGFNKTLSSSDIPHHPPTWGICARFHFSRGSLPSIPRVFVKFFNGPLDVSKSAESSCELGVEMWPSSKILVCFFIHLESVALCNYKTILGCPFLKGRICMKVAILEETQSYSVKFSNYTSLRTSHSYPPWN